MGIVHVILAYVIVILTHLVVVLGDVIAMDILQIHWIVLVMEDVIVTHRWQQPEQDGVAVKADACVIITVLLTLFTTMLQ